jgi:hydroxymethylpyrimidine/phosphomethylpyrimidine kinase
MSIVTAVTLSTPGRRVEDKLQRMVQTLSIRIVILIPNNMEMSFVTGTSVSRRTQTAIQSALNIRSRMNKRKLREEWRSGIRKVNQEKRVTAEEYQKETVLESEKPRRSEYQLVSQWRVPTQ